MNRFNLIALLHKSQLKLFIIGHKNDVEQIDLAFPEDTVSKSDIFDPVKFSFDIKNQLIKRPELRGSTILFLLPSEKVISKTVSLAGTNLETEKTKFFTDNPNSEEESLLSVYTRHGIAQFTSVPKKLINDIENSISKIGFKVVFLTLTQLVNLGLATKDKNLITFVLDEHLNLLLTGKDSLISVEEIDLGKEKEEAVFKKIEAVRDANQDLNAVVLMTSESWLKSYLDQNNYRVGLVNLEENIYNTFIHILHEHRKEVQKFIFGTEMDKARQGIHIPWKLLGTVIGLGVLGLVLFEVFILARDFGSNRADKPTVLTPIPTTVSVASQEATFTASPSAQPSTPSPIGIQKKDITVKILNGNGLPGDAGRFEKKVNGIGFTNTTTDTADKQGARDTVVKLSSKVTSEFKTEMQTLIEGDYAKVVFGSNPSSGIDIEIITGARK